MKKQVLICLFLQLVNCVEMRKQPERKSVRFQDDIEEGPSKSVSSDYFSFGQSKKKQKSRSSQKSTSSSSKKKPPQLKSALKPTKNPVIIAATTGAKSSNGAFDISSFRSTDNNSKAFIGDASSIGALDRNSIFYDSDQGPYVPQNPYRNIGPTPEIIDALSPERFWLPPNAPMTQEIPGPYLPYAQGVPGELAFDRRIRSEDVYLPQLTGITGPRDCGLTVDPLTTAEIANTSGVAAVDPYVPPYRLDRVLPPLNPVTPIPGGNIIDPLSPTVNNIRGPFFPDNPRNDGAYFVTEDIPPPQLVARDIEDGPYIVERVTDPIVFFDPVESQTVVYDPSSNFTRLYDPETDPELPIEELITETTYSTNSFPASSSRINGRLLKSMDANENGPRKPVFWILKKLNEENYKELEKSGGINGQPPQTGAANGARARIIYQTRDINPLKPAPPPKKQHISIKKPAKTQHQSSNPSSSTVSDHNPENIRIMLTRSNPNDEEKVQEKTGKISKTIKEEKGSNYKVTLVYRPIVDIDIGKRYDGFKANSNKNSAKSSFKPSFLALKVSLLLLLATLIL